MIKINNYKLTPAITATWGDITGDVRNQEDLMNILSGYATESWVKDQGYLTSPSLTGYATESWVKNQGYLTSTSLTGYATESWVNDQGYITDNALTGYATESWVSNQGYALNSDLKSLATRVSALEVNYGDAITITNNILG